METARRARIERLVSGGQTGVDRAALDWALSHGVPCGGWCPAGRLAEDGPLSARYPLKETPTPEYAQRTEWNVRDSDGTLVLAWGELTGGTAYTCLYAGHIDKPYCVVDLANADARDVERVATWIQRHGIRVLNVAGPRESIAPGVYETARTFIDTLFTAPSPLPEQ